MPPPRSWVEIDLAALRHNAEAARSHAGCEILGIVKANAYGHGAVPAAQALRGLAAVYGVANLREAEELRAAGIEEPILLLSACLQEEYEAVLRASFHLSVSTLTEAAAVNALSARLGLKAHAHAIVDTGMGRMGFLEEEWTTDVVRALLALPNLIWEGLASHLPSPDEDEDFTHAQIARFGDCVKLAHSAGLRPRWVHTASGAGLLGYAEQGQLCNLARPGLMLYGESPLPEYQSLLKRVMTWKTRIALIRELPAGHGISYGRSEILKRRTKVATLACGYADGYPRQVSGKGGQVLVRGTRCPLLGRVTMDQIMVDVTDLKSPAEVGDEVVLLGGAKDGDSISATELAGKAGTIAWHLFTGVTARVARCYLTP